MPFSADLQLRLEQRPAPRPTPADWIPSTDVTVVARISVAGAVLDPASTWAGQIELRGQDGSSSEGLFLVEWLVRERGRPWGPGGPPDRWRTEDTFYLGLGTTTVTKTMAVASERLDEDPALSGTVNLPTGPVPFSIPQSDEVFARLTFEPVGSTTVALPAVDSDVVTACFEEAPPR